MDVEVPFERFIEKDGKNDCQKMFQSAYGDFNQ